MTSYPVALTSVTGTWIEAYSRYLSEGRRFVATSWFLHLHFHLISLSLSLAPSQSDSLWICGISVGLLGSALVFEFSSPRFLCRPPFNVTVGWSVLKPRHFQPSRRTSTRYPDLPGTSLLQPPFTSRSSPFTVGSVYCHERFNSAATKSRDENFQPRSN